MRPTGLPPQPTRTATTRRARRIIGADNRSVAPRVKLRSAHRVGRVAGAPLQVAALVVRQRGVAGQGRVELPRRVEGHVVLAHAQLLAAEVPDLSPGGTPQVKPVRHGVSRTPTQSSSVAHVAVHSPVLPVGVRRRPREGRARAERADMCARRSPATARRRRPPTAPASHRVALAADRVAGTRDENRDRQGTGHVASYRRPARSVMETSCNRPHHRVSPRPGALTRLPGLSMIPPLTGRSMRLSSTLSIATLARAARASAIAATQDKANPGATSKDNMEFEPDNATSTPPSKTLERAIKLYDKKDFFSASIELKKVLDGESGDDAKNKQRAEFFMGKTLYQMGFYAGSLAYFDKIVQAGDAHTYHGATLKWLAALSRVLPETSGILEKIGTYDAVGARRSVARVGPRRAAVPARPPLLPPRRRRRLRQGDRAVPARCRATASSSSRRSSSRASPTSASTKASPRSTRSRRSSSSARSARRSTGPTTSTTTSELAQLQMARVFYSTQQFDTSIKYFEKLDQNSLDWTESLFEASWAYFMKTLNSKALGNIHTLNAPYFENQFFPESMLLKAVIYFKYCLYDQAEEAIADFNEKYSPLTQEPRGPRREVRRQRRVLRVREEGQGGQGRPRSDDPAPRDERAQRQDAAQDVRVGRRAQPRARDAAEVRQGVADHAGRRRGARRSSPSSSRSPRPTPARSPAIASTGSPASSARSSRDGSKIKFEILEAKATIAYRPRPPGRASPPITRKSRLSLTTNTFSGSLMASTGRTSWVTTGSRSGLGARSNEFLHQPAHRLAQRQ